MRAIALAAAVLLTAVEARAEDDTIQLDTEPRVVAAPPVLVAYPQSIEEYRLRIRTLRRARADARDLGDVAAMARIDSEIDVLTVWYQGNTHKENPGMVSTGIAMLVIGGAAFIGGIITLAIGFSSSCFICTKDNGAQAAITAGAILTVAGGVVAVGAIPILIIGNHRVIGPPETSLFIGPTGVHGTF